MKSASVAEAKDKLSELIARVSLNGEQVVITKRGRPAAALVSIEQLDMLCGMKEAGGLADAAGAWEGFDEVEKHINRAYASRGKDAGRKISL